MDTRRSADVTSRILGLLINEINHCGWSPHLCSIAEADDGDPSSTSVDIQVLNHIADKSEHVPLKVIVVHVTCRVDQKQCVSLLPARSSGFSRQDLAACQTYRTVSSSTIHQHFLHNMQLILRELNTPGDLADRRLEEYHSISTVLLPYC